MYGRSILLTPRKIGTLRSNFHANNLTQLNSFKLAKNFNRGISAFTSPLLKNAPSMSSSNALVPARNYSSSPIPQAPRFRTKISNYQERRASPFTGTELSTLTPQITTHLRNVYSSLATTTLIAGGAATFGMFSGVFISPMVSLIGGLGLILGINFTPPQNQALRLGMLYGFAGLQGLSFVPLIGSTLISSPVAVPAALIGTAGVFLGFTGVALTSKSRSMLRLGGPLLGSLIGIIVLNISGMFIPALAGIANSVGMYGGLAVFSAFISYDTQRMIENARMGQTDVVGDVLGMFLNVSNVFVSLLRIFRSDD